MISIIIPTHNSFKLLPCLLGNIKKQTIFDYELLILDSSSIDDTVCIARSFGAKVMVIPKETFDHGGTRTLGGKEARGEILIYMTQDALPESEDSIEKLIRPLLENEEIGAAYGRQLPHPGATPFAAHLRAFNYPPNSRVTCLEDGKKLGIKAPFISNSFSAYKKRALEEVGWFKSGLPMCEDTYAGSKLLLAGYKLAYVADSRVYHSHNYTALEEFKRYFAIGSFHKAEEWIIREFGKAGGEGLRYVRSELAYLAGLHKYHLLPLSVFRNALKFLGYKMGRNHKR